MALIHMSGLGDDTAQGGKQHHWYSHAGHDHAGHQHPVRLDADTRYLSIALALILSFMVAEVVVGLLAGSLALFSDAGHMLTDAAALALALVAARLARRPARDGLTFGLKRAEILSAQANGITLIALSGLFGFEAIRRLIWPPAVVGGAVLVVALVGIAVNLAATWALARANRSSLNVEGSYQHILTDLIAFIATAVAGGLIVLTHFGRFDALATLLVAALMLRAGIKLVGESWRVLLEAAPRGMSPRTIGATLQAVPGVERVHDLHVWSVTSGFLALSAHVHVAGNCQASEQAQLLNTLNQKLREQFGITHATLQLECSEGRACGCNDLYCALDGDTTAAADD
ncbi:MAG TPA: cation diffusion facilitator family transporter [Ktedonobacterales bacterium]|nr:cation diffusion facilitator family transporter [Ktedonobacterales bacterium]